MTWRAAWRLRPCACERWGCKPASPAPLHQRPQCTPRPRTGFAMRARALFITRAPHRPALVGPHGAWAPPERRSTWPVARPPSARSRTHPAWRSRACALQAGIGRAHPKRGSARRPHVLLRFLTMRRGSIGQGGREPGPVGERAEVYDAAALRQAPAKLQRNSRGARTRIAPTRGPSGNGRHRRRSHALAPCVAGDVSAERCSTAPLGAAQPLPAASHGVTRVAGIERRGCARLTFDAVMRLAGTSTRHRNVPRMHAAHAGAWPAVRRAASKS